MFRRTLLVASIVLFFTNPSSSAEAPEAEPADSLGAALVKLRATEDGNAQASAAWSRFRAGDEKAAHALASLARGGNPFAQQYIGYMLDNGDGVAKDSKAAAAYFGAAAPKVPLAKYNLGLLYQLGRGVEKDERKANELFEASLVDASIEQAAVRLARFHLLNGRSEEAKKWASKGADMGNAICFHILGRIAYERREYRDATNWLEKAAAGGDRNSPSYLAGIYSRGLGTEPTKIIATGWQLIGDVLSGRSRSAETGTLPGFSSGMTDNEIGRARGFAKEWLKERGGPQAVQYTKTIYEVRGWRR